MRTKIRILICAGVGWLAASESAHAVDGVVEINAASAAAGAVTPGDAPGYPVTLDQSGSYKLTGPLRTSGTTAIVVTTRGVRIDLNGFLIAASAPLSGAHGISAGVDDVEIVNGTLEGFGGAGIIANDHARIERVTVRSNGGAGAGPGIATGESSEIIRCKADANRGTGLEAGNASRVVESIASSNGAAGILVQDGALVEGNTAFSNAQAGIQTGQGATIRANAVRGNVGDGIVADIGSTLAHNTSSLNGGDGIEVVGGATILGNTLHSNTRCGLDASGSPRSGFAHNVIGDNNGSNANRQVFFGNLEEMDSSAATDSHFTNVCGGPGPGGDLCTTGAAASCP